MTLRLVHSRQVACWPWALRHCGVEPVVAACCRTCGRDVAQPAANQREAPVCIYCGLDSGLLAEIDSPLGEPLALADEG